MVRLAFLLLVLIAPTVVADASDAINDIPQPIDAEVAPFPVSEPPIDNVFGPLVDRYICLERADEPICTPICSPHGTRGPTPIWPDIELAQIGVSVQFDLGEAPAETFGPYRLGVRICT